MLKLTHSHIHIHTHILTCFMFLFWPIILLVFYRLPYYFSTVLRAASASLYRHASVYTAHCACAAHLSFFKLTDTWSEAEHETCSSSWLRDRYFYLDSALNLRIIFTFTLSFGLTPKLILILINIQVQSLGLMFKLILTLILIYPLIPVLPDYFIKNANPYKSVHGNLYTEHKNTYKSVQIVYLS